MLLYWPVLILTRRRESNFFNILSNFSTFLVRIGSLAGVVLSARKEGPLEEDSNLEPVLICVLIAKSADSPGQSCL